MLIGTFTNPTLWLAYIHRRYRYLTGQEKMRGMNKNGNIPIFPIYICIYSNMLNQKSFGKKMPSEILLWKHFCIFDLYWRWNRKKCCLLLFLRFWPIAQRSSNMFGPVWFIIWAHPTKFHFIAWYTQINPNSYLTSMGNLNSNIIRNLTGTLAFVKIHCV